VGGLKGTGQLLADFGGFGLAADGGAIWFPLTRRLGRPKAKEMVFSARLSRAEEALAMGGPRQPCRRG